MNIRNAHERDAAAIAALARELADHVADPDPGLDARAWLELGFGERRWFECLVAEIESEIIGFASYCRRFETHTLSRALWLGDLVVAWPYRRRGVGRRLISALRRRATKLECASIVVDLWRENATARMFYRRLGTVQMAEIETHIIPVASE